MRSGEDLRVGDRLGRYQLVRELGRGSMGLVFLAEDTMLHTPICVKVLHPALADHPEAAERFNREIVLARRISHKGVCRLHDIHREGDLRFITMEFVEGQPLRDLLQGDAPVLSVARVITIGASMCDALAAAHDVGVVHRDLKPRNIMIRPNGEATILDFGIATALDGTSSLTLPGIALGTKHYIAPEVWAGRPATPAADQFAVGVILFNCLTRRMPFNAPRDVLLLEAMSKGPPPPLAVLRPDVPAALDAVVRRALAFKPEARFPDVRALRDALLQLEGGAARPGGPLPPGVGGAVPDPVTAVLPATMPSLQAPTLVMPPVQSPEPSGFTLEATLVAPGPLASAPTLPANPPVSPGFVPSNPDSLPASDASWVVSGRAVGMPVIPKPILEQKAAVVRGIADMIEPEVTVRTRRKTPLAVALILLGAAGVAAAILAFAGRTGAASPHADGGAAAAREPPPGPAPGPGSAAPPPVPPSPTGPLVEPAPPPPAPAEPPPGAAAEAPTAAPASAAEDAPAGVAPKRRGADPSRARFLEARGKVERAMAARGLLAGDDDELDRLRQRAAQEARQKGFEAAARTLAEAGARADAVDIDRGFVERKLARFNGAFDKVSDPERRAAADARVAEVMSALSEKRYADANDILNRALAMVR